LLIAAAKDPESRAKVYSEMFEFSSPYRNVATFLEEIIANVFPKDFMVGKNKKVFNKKLL
jgi:hypothetical protein